MITDLGTSVLLSISGPVGFHFNSAMLNLSPIPEGPLTNRTAMTISHTVPNMPHKSIRGILDIMSRCP